MSKYIFEGPKSSKDKTVAVSYYDKFFRIGEQVELSKSEYGKLSDRFDFTLVGDSTEKVIEQPIVEPETLDDSESAEVDNFVGFNTVNDEEEENSSSFFNQKPTKNKEVK